MELRNALDQITEIRRGLSRAEVFRGYRSGPTAMSGSIALLAAFAQSWWIGDPEAQIERWATLWIAAALLGFGISVSPLIINLVSGSWRRSRTLVALEQLLPSYVAAVLVTAVILRFTPESAPLLPGLWQTFFALGLLASRHLLPGEVAFVAIFYLVCGTFALSCASSGQSLSPWMMGLPFGAGQLACAVILHLRLERSHVQA